MNSATRSRTSGVFLAAIRLPMTALLLIATGALLTPSGVAAAEPKSAPPPANAPAIHIKSGYAAASRAGEPWEISAGLQALFEGDLDAGATVFDSPDYQHQLVVPATGTHAFVLALRTHSVQILPKEAVTWTPEEAPVPDMSAAVDGGVFTSSGGVISFDIEGGEWVIQPEPPLVGSVAVHKLRAVKPDYALAADRYTPDPAAIRTLKGISADTQIVAFFGTWCTYCKTYLPRFMKALDAAGNPRIRAEYFGVSEDQVEPREPLRKYRVDATPSFIILQAGKEIGRISEKPEVSMEADLARILSGR